MQKKNLDKTTGTIFTNLPLDLTHIQGITAERALKVFVNKVS